MTLWLLGAPLVAGSQFPATHTLSYYTVEKDKSVRAEVKTVGVLGGYRVVDVLHRRGGHEVGAPKPVQRKAILVQVGLDRFREIHRCEAPARASAVVASSSIVFSDGEPVLASGGGGYWWFDSHGPHPLDFTRLREAIRKELPADVALPSSYSWLSFESRVGRVWVRKPGAQCRACDYAGALTVRFQLQGPAVVPAEVYFDAAPAVTAEP